MLEENKDKSPVRRDDFSSDDEDLAPNRAEANPLKDFTFVGGAGGLDLAPRKPPSQEEQKKLDSITAIRDYLERELGQDRLF